MKNRLLKWLFTLIGISSFNLLPAQDSSSIELNGYIKNLQTFSFIDNGDSIYLTNLVHNRINISYHGGRHFALNIGIRNLLYTGDQVKYTPGFGTFMDMDVGYFDLSFVWVKKSSLVFVTKFDRLNASWNFKKGFIRAGRQRINWGINPTWNPNDIFNTYNFIDFDYEERPGVDAVRFSYDLKEQSSIEVAVAPSKNDSTWISAVKYNFNKWNYDFQFIAGTYHNEVLGGIGFAGNIKDAGWKGELTYFHPLKKFLDTGVSISVSSGIDYGFKNGWYLNGAFLFNSAAPNQLYSLRQLQAFQLSPKMIMPAKWSFLLQAVKTFSPVFSGKIYVTYSPRLNLLILLPWLSYSISNSWDIDLNVQSFFIKESQSNIHSLGNLINVRVKWSY